MKIAVLGSGMVGTTIASKLVQLGHQVTMGSRTAQSDAGRQWQATAGPRAAIDTFAGAASAGELVFNCTNGANSLEALRQAGAEALRGKILIDVANPLDFSRGMPPSLTLCNTDSLGELLQREFPSTRVVKALNTMNCEVMVTPSLVPGNHRVFICGNDPAAKKIVGAHLAEWFGWRPAQIMDLGDIAAARGTEMTMPIWLRLWASIGHGHFNFDLAVGTPPA